MMNYFFLSKVLSLNFASCSSFTARKHDVRALEDLASECKEQMNMKMRNVSSKITEIIRLQKNTSGHVADIEEKAHYMNAEVDRVTDGQVCYQMDMLWRQAAGLNRAKLELELCANLALIFVDILKGKLMPLIGISI